MEKTGLNGNIIDKKGLEPGTVSGEVNSVFRLWVVNALCALVALALFFGDWFSPDFWSDSLMSTYGTGRTARPPRGKRPGDCRQPVYENERLARLTSWDAPWAGLHVVVVSGMGTSGDAAADVLAAGCAHHGYRQTVTPRSVSASRFTVTRTDR